jgi:hypothetical protein
MTPYFTTSRLKAQSSAWDPHRPKAEVLHGTFKGAFVAITITVRGSAWVCHPRKDGSEWHKRKQPGRAATSPDKAVPPRRIRKAAKLALRTWLSA